MDQINTLYIFNSQEVLCQLCGNKADAGEEKEKTAPWALPYTNEIKIPGGKPLISVFISISLEDAEAE